MEAAKADGPAPPPGFGGGAFGLENADEISRNPTPALTPAPSLGTASRAGAPPKGRVGLLGCPSLRRRADSCLRCAMLDASEVFAAVGIDSRLMLGIAGAAATGATATGAAATGASATGSAATSDTATGAAPTGRLAELSVSSMTRASAEEASSAFASAAAAVTMSSRARMSPSRVACRMDNRCSRVRHSWHVSRSMPVAMRSSKRGPCLDSHEYSFASLRK